MRGDNSVFIVGWIVWAILFFLTFGWAWLFGYSVIPVDEKIYYESGGYWYGSSLIIWPVMIYIVGWPLFGWVTLE